MFPKAAYMYLSTSIIGKPAGDHISRGVCTIIVHSQDVGGLSKGAWMLTRGWLLPHHYPRLCGAPTI